MPITRPRIRPLLAAVAVALAATPAVAATSHAWTLVPRAHLTVTEGSIERSGTHGALRVRVAAMRAVEADGGHHAARAQLRFRYMGQSTTTKPLGSGLVRRQIGLKLRTSDPCNLVYVMWRTYPDQAIAIFVKRNSGQVTSSQCENNGYTDVATIPLPGVSSGDHRSHLLAASTRRAADGTLVLRVFTDGTLLRQLALDATLTAGLDGPVGVRSDNGDYVFKLSAAGRS